MVTLSFTTAGREILRLAVGDSQPPQVISGDASWLDFNFQPRSATLGRPVSLSEDPEEWARSMVAAYAGSSTEVRIVDPAAAGSSAAQRAATISETSSPRQKPSLKAGWQLGKLCISALRQNKSLLAFPVLSSLAALAAAFLIMMPAGLGALLSGDANSISVVFYIAAGIAGYVTTVLAIFFNVALCFCSVQAFEGEQVSVSSGLSLAVKKLPVILGWALIATAIGYVIRAIENSHQIVATIVAAVFGLLWAAATMFVIPALALDGTSLGAATNGAQRCSG